MLIPHSIETFLRLGYVLTFWKDQDAEDPVHVHCSIGWKKWGEGSERFGTGYRPLDAAQSAYNNLITNCGEIPHTGEEYEVP